MTDRTPSERLDRIGARINHARERLAKRSGQEWTTIGEMLKSLSEDLDTAAHHEDEAAAHARLDDVEFRLSKAHSKLDEAEKRGT